MKAAIPIFTRLLAVIVAMLVITFLARSLRTLDEARNLGQIRERVHIVSVKLKEYVNDRGTFPESLESLQTEMALDARLLQPIAGEKIEYFRPETNASDDVLILVVTMRSNRITLDKAF